MRTRVYYYRYHPYKNLTYFTNAAWYFSITLSSRMARIAIFLQYIIIILSLPPKILPDSISGSDSDNEHELYVLFETSVLRIDISD
jgi:hypothetical protein